MRRFEGKVAVVTGAAQGIGRAIACRFIAEGGRVVAADIDRDALEATAAALGGRAVAAAVDVRDGASVKEMARKASDAFGKIDVLFNNAGILTFGKFLHLKEEAFDDIIAVNVKGSFLAAQAVGRVMAARGEGGAIVNTVSAMSELAVAGTLGYTASKGALRQMTRAMALEMAPCGIRVNGIGPGFVRTRMMERTASDEKQMAFFLPQWAIKRLATPEEQAAVALFLASEDASYMTGEIIYADGGWMIG